MPNLLGKEKGVSWAMLPAMTINQRKPSEVMNRYWWEPPEQKSRMSFQIWRMITNLVHARWWTIFALNLRQTKLQPSHSFMSSICIGSLSTTLFTANSIWRHSFTLWPYLPPIATSQSSSVAFTSAGGARHRIFVAQRVGHFSLLA